MKAVAERENKSKTGSLTREEGNQNQFVAPEVNIFETSEGYVLEAEMPGVNREGLEITLEGNTLTLSGRRADEVPGDALYRESRAANFRRAFELDPAIDTAKIGAEMNAGVLTLKLPKAERVKPRKISVD